MKSCASKSKPISRKKLGKPKAHKTDKQNKVMITICTGCPCLNNDYEKGSSCNLGYTTEFMWFDENGKIVDHHNPPNIRTRREFMDASKDCELTCVDYRKNGQLKIFKPIRK